MNFRQYVRLLSPPSLLHPDCSHFFRRRSPPLLHRLHGLEGEGGRSRSSTSSIYTTCRHTTMSRVCVSFLVMVFVVILESACLGVAHDVGSSSPTSFHGIDLAGEDTPNKSACWSGRFGHGAASSYLGHKWRTQNVHLGKIH